MIIRSGNPKYEVRILDCQTGHELTKRRIRILYCHWVYHICNYLIDNKFVKIYEVNLQKFDDHITLQKVLKNSYIYKLAVIYRHYKYGRYNKGFHFLQLDNSRS